MFLARCFFDTIKQAEKERFLQEFQSPMPDYFDMDVEIVATIPICMSK
jgi:hypothetical protein